MSENTFGIIFRNVRFGDDRIGTVSLTVLAHQSFRVQVRTKREKTLLSALLQETTTCNKRKCMTCHLSLWQKCYKMPDCLIKHTSWKMPTKMKRIKVFFSMAAYENHPTGSSRWAQLHFSPDSQRDLPIGYFYKRVPNEWGNQRHVATMLRNQDWAEYITWHASTGPCRSPCLARPFPWQIKINSKRQMNTHTGEF